MATSQVLRVCRIVQGSHNPEAPAIRLELTPQNVEAPGRGRLDLDGLRLGALVEVTVKPDPQEEQA